jgi:hypothetical protein
MSAYCSKDANAGSSRGEDSAQPNNGGVQAVGTTNDNPTEIPNDVDDDIPLIRQRTTTATTTQTPAPRPRKR